MTSKLTMQVNHVNLFRLALSEMIFLDMGPVQIVGTQCNRLMHNCTVHSWQIMQIYWAALEKNKFGQLKNIPHTIIRNSKSASSLLFQKGCGETGEVQLTAIKMTWA